MNIDQALEQIYSLKQFHVKLGLDNITSLMNNLNNPQRNLKIFHVAGSNGKGSTCSFLSSILQEYGYKIGLYTSPHFIKFNERIRINGETIPNEYIINFLEVNKAYIESDKPTFFEISTALSFQYFEEFGVDYAVIETGLGGRLDATNIADPIASVITSISYEHTHILGESLSEIAAEKAGIIKRNKPVFIGKVPEEAELRIQQIALEKGAELYKAADYSKAENDKLILRVGKNILELADAGLKGSHQLENAALSVLSLSKVLGLENIKNYYKGIDNVVLNTGLQGRYERAGINGNIIFDAAHNSESIEIFLNLFRNEYSLFQKNYLIFGAMKDKDIGGMLKKLNPYFSKIYVSSINYERAASAEDIKSIAENNNLEVEILSHPEKIIKKFDNKISKDCLVILGSIYLLGQIKKLILNEN